MWLIKNKMIKQLKMRFRKPEARVLSLAEGYYIPNGSNKNSIKVKDIIYNRPRYA
jgi:hypothetical protein